MKAPGTRHLVFLILTASLVSPVSAQDIFKCVDEAGTAYQSKPCATGVRETQLATGGAPPRLEISVPAPNAAPARRPSRKAGPWKHKTLTLGMSDDEVLNMPGWGRPARITRVRMPREWREEWVYVQALEGERRLHFANAKLIDFSYAPLVEQLVRASPD